MVIRGKKLSPPYCILPSRLEIVVYSQITLLLFLDVTERKRMTAQLMKIK